MATTTVSGSTVTFSNSGAAADLTQSGTEDGSLQFTFDVLAASGGGTKTTIYSVDDGVKNDDGGAAIVVTNKAFADYNKDLLIQDGANVIETSSTSGAKFWIGSDNKIHYDASAPALAAQINALGAGEQFTDTIQYTIKMSNGTLSVGTLTVVITGTNDAPVITVAAGDHDAAGLTETNSPLSTNGTLTVGDADTHDTVNASVTGVTLGGATGSLHSADVLNMLSLGGNPVIDSSHTSGKINWSFNSTPQAFDYLAAGEHLTLTYTVKADDGHGGTTTHDVTITINGTNDAASIGVVAGGDYAVSEAGGVNNASAGDPSASGQVTVSDVDDGEAHFQAPASLNGTYGTFTFDDQTGQWTYTLDNDRAATQALNGGDAVTDTLTVTSADGTAQHDIVVNITGANDAASIGVVAGGDYAVSEAGGVNNASAGDPSASGQVTVSDVDDGEAHFQAPASLNGTYGTFTFDDQTGQWTYALDNDRAATQALNGGDAVTDTLTVTSADGTAQHDIVVNITGANDAASIGVVAGGDYAVSEAGGVNNASAGDPSASGQVTVSDVDDGEAHFQAPASLNGTYGTFTFDDQTGQWTYALDNDRAATQALNGGDAVTDTLTVTSADGTAQHDIVVNITGANDAASIGVVAGGDYAVSEAGGVNNASAGDPSASGQVTVSDVDDGEAHFQAPASLNGTYGTFTFDDQTGQWTYTLDNDRAATQALNGGDAVTDTLTVTSADGTAQHDIVVNITGANDAASIGVVAGGDYAVSEAGGVNNASAGDPSASGQVTVSDVDDGEAHFQAPASLNGTYGTFTFDDQTGQWTYALDNDRAATQALNGGDAVTDTLTVTSADGTAQHDIVVNITGTNDAASIGVVAGGDYAVSEAGGVNNASAGDPSASGQVTVSDVDDGEAHFQAPASLNGTYGTFTFDDQTGQWTYTLDNDRAATQALNGGDAVTDTLTVTSADGTAQHDIVVNITGANDAASIGVVAGGDYAVSEAGGVNNASAGDPSASGQVTVSDVDDGEAHFQAPASLNGTYGTFTFDDQTGQWTYALDNDRAATQALNGGDAVTDTLTVTSADGTAQHDIVVNITGANDAASIGVVAGGDYAVSEAGGVNNASAGDPSASGQVTVSDVDDGEAHFQAPASLNGTYGTFTFDDQTGQWTYALDNDRAATQALNGGDGVTDTLTVTSADGTAQHDIVVNITGANDAASIGVVAGGDYAVSEAGGVNNASAGDPSASGQVTVSDVDDGEAHFQAPASLNGTYGTFTFDDQTGQWTYALDNDRAATQALNGGDAVTDTLTVTSADGTAQHDIVVNITGANDAASIGVVAGGDYAVSEAGGVNNASAGDPSASGQVTVSDVDDGEAHFQAPASLNGTYGTFTFDDQTGQWTYALDNDRAATQALNGGDAVTDTLTVTSADGTAQHDIVVNITGANDAASIGVVAGGDYAVSEAGGVNNASAGDPSASGQVTVSDVDDGEAHFQAPASLNGTYGTFTFDDQTGQWTYTLDNDRAATQALNGGDAVTDTLTVTSADGTAHHDIVVNITGANDAASIGVVAGGDYAVSEAGGVNNASAGDPSASGQVTVSDVDDGEAHFQAPASLNGTYGTFTFDDQTGQWTYALDNDRAATQALNGGDAVTDTLTVTSADGTAQHDIVVNITGANDAASIGVVAGGDYAVSEAGGVNNASAGDPSASGQVTVSDVDDGEAHFQAPASLNGTYGTFTFDDQTGQWTYTLDNDRAATQALNGGDAVTDTLTVTSADGTAQHDIVVNITGANDAASIGVVAGGDYAVSEAGGVNNASAGDPSASGQVTVSDVDDGEAHFQAPASLNGTYGTFTFDDQTGQWTYALDNDRAATQALNGGDAVTDTLTVTSADGTAQHDIVVNITGANDAASIGVVAGGDYAVSEAGGVNNASAGDPSASGQVTVSDVDDGEAHFQAPASLNGTYGTFTFDDQTGQWTYALDNDRAATQALNGGDAVTDTLTVTSADGTAQHDIVVNITGANDAASIGVVAGGDYAVSEAGGVNNASAGDPSASGQVTVSDVDDGEAHFQAPASLNGTYGTFTFDDQTGQWTYALDNDRAATQALNGGDAVTDTLTVTSADGTAQHDIVVNITGANDAPVITGSSSGAVTEDAVLTVNGALSINDPDAGQSSFQVHDGSNPIAGTYGSLTIDAGGNWVYTLNNGAANVQALTSTDHPHDQIHVSSADGTDHVIDITVNGADEPVTNHAPSAPVFVPNSTPSPDGQAPSLGSFISTDPDAQDTVTFTGTFTPGLNSNGSVSVSSGGALIVNVPTGQTLNGTLTVTATDNHAASSSPQTFNVWIGNGSSGANGNDVGIVLSSTNPNIADGRAGTDGLTGSSGVDYIFGGSGNDTIKGLGGADWLSGGAGDDHFRFEAVSDSTHSAFDTILDFQHGTLATGHDFIDFASALGLTATGTVSGGNLAAHTVAWQSDGSGNTIVYANTGSSAESVAGGAHIIEIHLMGVSTLTASDFNLSA